MRPLNEQCRVADGESLILAPLLCSLHHRNEGRMPYDLVLGTGYLRRITSHLHCRPDRRPVAESSRWNGCFFTSSSLIVISRVPTSCSVSRFAFSSSTVNPSSTTSLRQGTSLCTDSQMM